MFPFSVFLFYSLTYYFFLGFTFIGRIGQQLTLNIPAINKIIKDIYIYMSWCVYASEKDNNGAWV